MARRRPTDDEARLLSTLADCAAEGGCPPASWVDAVLVEEMDDGGMGSLRLYLEMEQRRKDSLRGIAELQFDDSDGVPVIAELFVDSNRIPIELDVWKVDCNSTQRIPDPLPEAYRPEDRPTPPNSA